MAKIKLAFMVSLEKYKDKFLDMRSIEELELTSIYSPQSNSESFIISDQLQLPVFSDLDIFLRKLSCDVLVDTLGIPGIKERLDEHGKSHIIITKEQSVFDILVKRLAEAIKTVKRSEAIMEAAQEGIQVVDAKMHSLRKLFLCAHHGVPLEERIGKTSSMYLPTAARKSCEKRGQYLEIPM